MVQIPTSTGFAVAAKQAFIAWQQVKALRVRIQENTTDIDNVIEQYHSLTGRIKQLLSIDPDFTEALEIVKECPPEAPDIAGIERLHVAATGLAILDSTLDAFVQLYMSEEERKRTIGFHPTSRK